MLISQLIFDREQEALIVGDAWSKGDLFQKWRERSSEFLKIYKDFVGKIPKQRDTFKIFYLSMQYYVKSVWRFGVFQFSKHSDWFFTQCKSIRKFNYLYYLYSKLKHSFDITFFISNKISVILYKVCVREDVFSTTYTYSTYSIVLLLKNNLTNISSKISKIKMSLWMACTCNMKSSGGKYERWEEGECTLRHWPKSWEICGCTTPF